MIKASQTHTILKWFGEHIVTTPMGIVKMETSLLILLDIYVGIILFVRLWYTKCLPLSLNKIKLSTLKYRVVLSTHIWRQISQSTGFFQSTKRYVDIYIYPSIPFLPLISKCTITSYLTHCDRDKMADILQTTSSNVFSQWKCLNF